MVTVNAAVKAKVTDTVTVNAVAKAKDMVKATDTANAVEADTATTNSEL